MYPEMAAGGYSRLDGTVAFYQRVQALAHATDGPITVVDLGAGRGRSVEDRVKFRRDLQDLRGPQRTVIGLDVDPAVMTNSLLDEARLIPESGLLPLENASVDLVVSRFVWEHIENPRVVADELLRVVKPGGWICSQTPNRWGYIAIGARLVPNSLHVGVLRRLQPTKAAQDTFPTRYKMNTRRSIERLFPAPAFEVYAYTHDAEPELYAGGSRALTFVIRLLRLLPPPLRSMWQVFVRRT